MLNTALVGLAAIQPAGAPLGFVAGGGSVGDASVEHSLGGFAVFNGGGGSTGLAAHFQQDVAHSPSLAIVTFAGLDAFAFEIDVVDQCVDALRAFRDGVKGGAKAGFPAGVGGGGNHFGQRLFEALDDEAGLDIDGVGEKVAQFDHARGIFCGMEIRVAVPRAAALSGEPGGHLNAVGLHVGDQFGKALVKVGRATGHVPDKMSDAERGKIFTLVPTGQAGDGAGAFVLPDLVADLAPLVGAEFDAASRRRGAVAAPVGSGGREGSHATACEQGQRQRKAEHATCRQAVRLKPMRKLVQSGGNFRCGHHQGKFGLQAGQSAARRNIAHHGELRHECEKRQAENEQHYLRLLKEIHCVLVKITIIIIN